MTGCKCERMLMDEGTCVFCGHGSAVARNVTLGAPRHPAVASIRPVRDCRPWTRSMVLAAIQRWHRERGRPPRMLEWQHSGAWWPNDYIVRRLFPSWKAAIFAAGFDPPRQGRPSRYQHDREAA